MQLSAVERECRNGRKRLYSKLSWFKRNENSEPVLIVADDPESIKIIVAWSALQVRTVERKPPLPGESGEETWDWLWANAQHSVSNLAEMSGLTAHLVERELKPFIGNRALYPDGTANSFVQRYLRERALKLFD